MWSRKQRPLQPFEFHGDIPERYSHEYLEILEAAARRRQTFRPPSADQLRKQAKAEQAKSGIRIRIERPVVNYADFVPQMAAWYKQETEGKVARRKLGNVNGQRSLHLTLLDTRDTNEMLGAIDDSLTLEDLERKFDDRRPSLFSQTGRIAFTDLELFGPKLKPWAALPISSAAHSLHEERRIMREIVAPSSGESDNRLHTSLGDITVLDVDQIASTFNTLKRGIVPLLPGYIEYGPIEISVSHNPQ